MMKKEKKDKKKIKGGFSLFSSTDFYPSAITLNGLRYLSWKNIPIGTLVILTVGNQEICRVVSGPLSNSDPRFGPIYVLIDIKTGQEGTFISYDFRVLVVMSGATIFNTNNRIDNEFFYGIISGISESEDTRNLYITGINNTNHLIFNTYNKTDINDNNVQIMTINDISEAYKLTGIYLDNFIDSIKGHIHEDKILNLKITRNGIWELSNLLNSSHIPTGTPYVFDESSGGPQNDPFGGPYAFKNARFGASRGTSPTQPFGASEGPSFGGPQNDPFGGPYAFKNARFGASEGPFFGGPTPPPFGASGGPSFGGPTPPPFGASEGPSFGGPTPPPFGASGGPSFGGPTPPPFGASGGPSFGGPTPPPFGASGGPSFGGPTPPPFGASDSHYGQAKSKNPSNYPEEAANIIIKHFYTDAKYLTAANFASIRENSIKDYSIIKNKLMGNEPFEDKDFKKNFNKAIIKIHPDKIDIEKLMNIINEENKKNITREILFEGANIARNVLTELQNPKIVTGGKTSLYKKVYKKEILGKNRVIYKISGSNKEYIKNKGQYVLATEYKKSKK
jgi:transcriptional regulator NrdR family protein